MEMKWKREQRMCDPHRAGSNNYQWGMRKTPTDRFLLYGFSVTYDLTENSYFRMGGYVLTMIRIFIALDYQKA